MKIYTRFYYHEDLYEATYVTILGDYCCPYSMDKSIVQNINFGPWRYQHILFTYVSWDSLVLWVKHTCWWTSKEISGIVLDVRYKIISIIYEYELDQNILSIRTILICSNRCLNHGGCWKIITIIHPCCFQNFVNLSSLINLKFTMI